jgi:gluconate 2-dehydrogenase gamma chain
MKPTSSQLNQKAQQLLNSPSVGEPTRNALLKRIEISKQKNCFFNEMDFQLLSVVCDLLMDQESGNRIVNVAVFIDERLMRNTCDGWRYNEMPRDGEMYLRGLEGIDETSVQTFQKRFIELKKEEQLLVLSQIQNGTATGNMWKTLPAKRFFEEILAEATEIFFSYPAVQMEINYSGMADAGGWKKVGLNEKDDIQEKV